MDANTFFDRTRKFIIDLFRKETVNRAVRSQATTCIRFIKDGILQFISNISLITRLKTNLHKWNNVLLCC